MRRAGSLVDISVAHFGCLLVQKASCWRILYSSTISIVVIYSTICVCNIDKYNYASEIVLMMQSITTVHFYMNRFTNLCIYSCASAQMVSASKPNIDKNKFKSMNLCI